MSYVRRWLRPGATPFLLIMLLTGLWLGGCSSAGDDEALPTAAAFVTATPSQPPEATSTSTPAQQATPTATAVATEVPSPTEPPATTTTATTPTAPAPPATIDAPPPPVPTATPAPADNGIMIQGSARFEAWTEEALALLRDYAPRWYNQVVSSIDVIVEVDAGTGINPVTRTMRVGVQTAYAPEHTREKQLQWFASAMVHDSCHSDRYYRGEVWSGRDGELACLMDQLEALLLIEDDDLFFTMYIQGLIKGVDDPDNQYWNLEHRHW